MNDLMKNPMVLGGVVLILIVVAVGGKLGSGGATYAATSTDPTAFKARAEAQAITDESQTTARTGIMTALLGYDKQRNEFRTGMAELRSNYNLGMTEMQTTERLGMAGLQSQERLGMAGIQSQERQNADNNTTERDGQAYGFWGNLLGGVMSFIGALL